jgi:hypothetical protein
MERKPLQQMPLRSVVLPLRLVTCFHVFLRSLGERVGVP